MHSLENDFIIIDNFNGKIEFLKEQVISLCDRQKGIGANGVILVETRPEVDCFMNYYNSNGIKAENCDNSINCVVGFLKAYYLKDKKEFIIGTREGNKEVKYKDGAKGSFSGIFEID